MVAKKTNLKRRKVSKKKVIKLILLIMLIMFIINIINRGEEKVNKTKLILSNQDITNELEKDVIKHYNEIYLSFNDIQKFIDKTLYQENEDGSIITTSEKKVAKLDLNKNQITINGSKIAIKGKAFKENGTIYLPISDLEKVYDIDLNYIENNNIIIIDYYSKKLIKANAKKSLSIKEKMSNFSKTIEKVKKETSVIVISEEGKWTRIRTQSGNIGYVKSKRLNNFTTVRDDMETLDIDKTTTKYYTKNIKKENIKTYNKREKLISNILEETVKNGYMAVKIKGTNKQEGWERFKIEVKPILKECGIKVKFD